MVKQQKAHVRFMMFIVYAVINIVSEGEIIATYVS